MDILYKWKYWEKYKFFIFFAVIFLFFTPMSLNLLVESGYRIWKLVDYGYDGMQLLLSAFGCFLWLRNPKREKSDWFIFILLHIFLMLLSGIFNGVTDLGQIRRMFCLLGFCLLCVELIGHSKELFIWAGATVFALYSLFGTVTVFLFPKGFFNAATTYSAIYGLGAKNNAFPWYFAFLFFAFLMFCFEKKRQCYLIPVAGLVTIASGIITGSVNTVLCLSLAVILFFGVKLFGKWVGKLHPLVLLGAFIIMVLLLYTGIASKLLEGILESFDRSATFSGRDLLWSQAWERFKEHPLFGAGWECEFTLRSGRIASHAHSQWLDKLAKYGLLQAIALILSLYITFRRAARASNKNEVNVGILLLLIYMLHMSFDVYNYNFFTMFLIVVNYLTKAEHTSIVYDKTITFKNRLLNKVKQSNDVH